MSKVCKGLIAELEETLALESLRDRASGKRPKGRNYLIVCEGTKTEPNYFEALRKKLSGGEGDKIVIVGAQDNTLGIVDRARYEIALRNRSDNPPYYHVWLVFDRDSFPVDDFDNAIAIAADEDSKFKAEGDLISPHWNAAWSNEAFELWYLFHFQENTGGAISRDRYKDMLSEHLGFRYEKNDHGMFERLLPYVEDALARAERASKKWSSTTPYHDRNPCTEVYRLVSDLLMYI